MVTVNQTTKTTRPPLRDQFAEFEDKTRNEFDENGWEIFTDRTSAYINDLYVGTRRECISRNNNEVNLKYSGKDVERASMRLDFQRLYGRKQRQYLFQIGAMVGSVLTGIAGSWAYTDIYGTKPSALPWFVLVALLVITVILFSLSFIKDMEP
ncbi:MAG: hypothetical protein A4E65_00993 [Syntrophorhabdus sp. PtaU1.Bin153]|nr:MAG: hypothetical protein A4E65_00993 [Syntrophorhabdus sp. PtaU1.Bin153]